MVCFLDDDSEENGEEVGEIYLADAAAIGARVIDLLCDWVGENAIKKPLDDSHLVKWVKSAANEVAQGGCLGVQEIRAVQRGFFGEDFPKTIRTLQDRVADAEKLR